MNYFFGGGGNRGMPKDDWLCFFPWALWLETDVKGLIPSPSKVEWFFTRVVTV